MNETFNIFVASSLSLRNERQAILKLVEELNQSENLYDATFSVFEYEESDNVLQIYNSVDAQCPIEENLRQSAFFILLCDSVVGNKTVDEFLHARRLFEAKKFPAYIYVLAKDYGNSDETLKVPAENQISYADFEARYNLFRRLDDDGDVADYKKIYSIPYVDGNDIRKRLRHELLKILSRPTYRPLINAKLGRDISASDFYYDSQRMQHCQQGLYFKREFDKKIIQAIENQNKFIYIHGTSLSGKTRSVIYAAHQCADTWFYVFRSNEELMEMAQKMRVIADYVTNFKFNQSLCIVFDDFDQTSLLLDPEISWKSYKAFNSAFKALMGAVNMHESSETCGACSVIFTASTPVDSVLDENIDRNNLTVIPILPLSSQEMMEACRYFQLRGKTITDKNRAYHTTGALLIDLEGIKVNYQAFATDFKSCGMAILQTIKALSIWKKRNLGCIEYIRSFAEDYHTRNNETEFKGFGEAIRYLCDECKGIAESPEKGAKGNLVIEEYVYRYIIKDVLEELSRKEFREIDMADVIMDYSFRTGQEPIIVTAGKVIRRCENQPEMATHLFDIFASESPQDGWKQALHAMKRQIEESTDALEEERKAYSHIYRRKMYASASFADALAIFNTASWCEELMLGALIEKAETQEDITSVEQLSQFGNAKDSSWIKLRRAMKENGFREAYAWVAECILPLPGNELEFHHMQGLMSYYLKTMQHMLCLMSSEAELELVLGHLRRNYHALQTDVYSVKAIGDDIRPRLTLFDLLHQCSTYTISTAFKRLMSLSERDEYGFITQYLIPLAEEAIRNGYTSRKIIRQLGGMIVNAILDQVPAEVSYETVFNDVFLPLSFEYADQQGIVHTMNLRNGYLYTKMMAREDCDYWKASELIHDYLVPQSQDHDNYLVVTRYILNTFVNLASRENSQTLLNNAFALFEQYTVVPDVFTFNQLMKHARSFEEGLDYLRRMLAQGVSPDNYTFVNLLESSRNVYTVIAHLDIPETVTRGLSLPGILGGDKALLEQLAMDFDIKDVKKVVSSQEYAWDLLFKEIMCKTEKEAQAKYAVLHYMEETPKLHEFLQRSTIYSCCLKDRKMVPTASSARNLLTSIEQLGITTLDSYIYAEALAVYKRAKVGLTDLNALFADIYAHIGDSIHCCNSRLDFFKAYTLKTLCLIPGDTESILLTPMGYIRKLVERGMVINESTVIRFINIGRNSKTFAPAADYTDLVGICRSQNVEMNQETTYNLYQVCQQVLSADDHEEDACCRYLHERLLSFPSYEQNKLIVSQFVHSKSMDYMQPASRISTDNVASATIAYNSILHVYVSRYKDSLNKKNKADLGQAEVLDKAAFFEQRILPYYKQFYVGSVVPTAETISILAGKAGNMQQMQDVLMLARQHRIPRVTEHCFTSMLSVVGRYDDIRTLCDLYRDINGVVTPRLLSPLVTTIQSRSGHDRTCRQLMTLIARYLFPDTEDAARLAENKERLDRYVAELGILDYLFSPANIDIHIIRSVFRFRQAAADYKGKDVFSDWRVRFDLIFDEIYSRYAHVCGESVRGKAGFIESLVFDEYIKIYDNTYLKLFWQTAKVNPETRISCAFARLLLSHVRHWGDYSRLMEAFSLTKPQWIIELVPDLFDILYRLKEAKVEGDPRFNKQKIYADRVWKRVSCYAPMVRLHVGHFLPMGNEISFSDPWAATRIFNSPAIYKERQSVEASHNGFKRAYEDASALRDAYYVALWFLANEHEGKLKFYDIRNGKNEPTSLCQRIHEYEDRYVALLAPDTETDANAEPQISCWRPSLRNMLQLPLYWDRIGYTPRHEIVLAIIARLRELSFGQTYEQSAANAIIKNLRYMMKQEESRFKAEKSRLPADVILPLSKLNKNIGSDRYVRLRRKDLIPILFARMNRYVEAKVEDVKAAISDVRENAG